MSPPRLPLRRAVLILVLAAVAIVGTVNLALRRQVPFRVALDGQYVVVDRAATGSGARDGDVVQAINGVRIYGLPEAAWTLSWVPSHGNAALTLSRNESVFTAIIPAENASPPVYLFLDRLTGLAFLALGLFVWWNSRGDPTVSAFLRVNLIIGTAALLNDFPSVFASPGIQAAFASIYLSLRTLVPAALIDFIQRFTSERPPAVTDRRIRLVSYGLSVVIALAISVSVVMARLTSETVWIIRFDVLNRTVCGLWLLVAVGLTVVRLVYVAGKTQNAWHRKRLHWLLLCLVIGATPYVVLEKLPTLWGWSPFIPPDLAMAMLMITPIGWAMAVASFHMLRVQWNLSRTFVYVVTVGITIYTVGGLMMLSSALARHELVARPLLVFLAAIILIIFVSRALVDRVRWAVDRAFYGDWFDYRRTTRELQNKLSNSLREQDLVPVLTDEIASILKVERSTLVVRNRDVSHRADNGDWCALSKDSVETTGSWQSFSPPEGKVQSLEFIDGAAGSDYVLAVPLTHAETTRGWLLLGRKKSGAPFSGRDRLLLNFLSPVAGMALANVELYRQLMDQERRMVVIELAGGIAHEIGNALSPLMGQAQLLEYALEHHHDDVPRTAVAPPLKIMTEMCARIRRIVQNLSRLSQPVVLEKSAVDLNRVAEEAIQLMSETAGRIKRYQLEDDTDGIVASPCRLRKQFCAEMPTVPADHQLLSQVFINLILNAADAMEAQGAGVLTVGTSISTEPPGVIGFVQDTGPGVPAGLAEKLFLPYFTTKPEGKGTGLGLSFVRSIIEAHQGSVTVRSPAEGGTCFEFFLPARLSVDRSRNR